MSKRLRNEFLDDLDNAQTLMDEKRARAKELIYQIIGVTSGWNALVKNPTREQREWAQGHFLELLEIFMIRHDNFSSSTLAEDLQHDIFAYSFAYDNAYSEWRKKTFASRDMDDNGEPLEAVEQVSDAPKQPTDRQKEYVQEVAEKVALAFESENVSEGIKDALKSIISEAATEAGIDIDDDNSIYNQLPKTIETLDWDYGRGFLHSIAAILRFDTDVENVYLDKQKASEKVLDVSEHPENLNILASQLSAIMKNPNLPTKIYNCLADELSEIHIDTDAPENILANLKSQTEQ